MKVSSGASYAMKIYRRARKEMNIFIEGYGPGQIKIAEKEELRIVRQFLYDMRPGNKLMFFPEDPSPVVYKGVKIMLPRQPKPL